MDGDNICYEQSKDDEQVTNIDGKDDERNRMLSSGKSNEGAVNKKFVLCDRNGQLSSSIMCPESYFDYLPEELFVEILKKCPKNLIHRYKCVSKRWLELISRDVTLNSKPLFALFHQHRVSGPPFKDNGLCSVFSDDPIFKSSGFSLDFLSLGVDVLGSSNGLVLCKAYKHANTYYVCNPLTKEWVTVPPPPNKCWHTYLIGFVCKFTTSGCDFRIVRVSNVRWHNDSFKLETYVSEVGKWRESFFGLSAYQTFFNYNYPSVSLCEAIACNGLLHWVNNLGNILVSYPFQGNGKYKVISAPVMSTEMYKNKPRIGLSNGRLRYFERGFENYSVWELEDYETEKWRLVQDFSLSQMDYTDYAQRSLKYALPLAFHPFDQDIVCLELDNRILWYNISSKKMLLVCNLVAHRKMSFFWIVLSSWPVPVSLH